MGLFSLYGMGSLNHVKGILNCGVFFDVLESATLQFARSLGRSFTHQQP